MALPVSNIALIGFRATGKTTIGQALATRIGWAFVDMDEQLTATFGTDIQTWVRQHGWDAFRDCEARLLEELANGERQVVATGGGVILRPVNRERLRRRFLVVWLKASIATIEARLAQDPKTISQRPPLTDLGWQDEIAHLLEERSPLYAATAHLALDTDGRDTMSLVTTILAKCRQSKHPAIGSAMPGSS